VLPPFLDLEWARLALDFRDVQDFWQCSCIHDGSCLLLISLVIVSLHSSGSVSNSACQRINTCTSLFIVYAIYFYSFLSIDKFIY